MRFPVRVGSSFVFGTTGYSAPYTKSITDEAGVAAERSLTTLCPHAASH